MKYEYATLMEWWALRSSGLLGSEYWKFLTDISRKIYRSPLGLLTYENGTDKLSRNVASYQPRRAYFSSTSRRRADITLDGKIFTDKPEILGDKSVSVSRFSPKPSNAVAWDQTWVSLISKLFSWQYLAGVVIVY